MTKNNDYVFASSLLRAKEKAGSPAVRLESFINSPSLDALWQNAANSFGINSAEKGEALLEFAMADAVTSIKEAVPDFSVFAPLLYKYDCTNVKLCIKAHIMGISPEGMLFSCGSVPANEVISSYEKKELGFLPSSMRVAAKNAVELYRKSGETRLVDLTLDKACFEDICRDTADAPDCIKKVVSMKADIANVLTAMRIKSSGMDTDASISLIERALVSGGEIDLCAFYSRDGIKNIEEITEAAKSTMLYNALKKITRSGNLSQLSIEKELSDAVLSEIAPVKYVSFGPEVVVHYLLVREAEILNIRIIAAALAGHISSEDIRERVSRAYV